MRYRSTKPVDRDASAFVLIIDTFRRAVMCCAIVEPTRPQKVLFFQDAHIPNRWNR